MTLRRWCRDEAGQALVEFALVLPVVILLVGVAFNGWNGMQRAIRLTSAVRAGAIQAAHDLAVNPGAGLTCTTGSALSDATNAINLEEGVPSGTYQCGNATANNYVSAVQSSSTIGGGATINLVTISISGAEITLVPFVGKFSVSTHAEARWS